MSSKAEFIHLHNHSEYSLLDGTTRFSDHDGKPSELLKSLAHGGSKGMALTDHGNLFGAVEFYTQCNAVGLKPIIGCEMYLAKGSRKEKGGSQKENCHLTVLARTNEGYKNLMALASKASLEGFYYDPRIDKELLAEHSKGLIVLSGCLKSELSQMILTGNLKAAIDLAMQYRDRLEPGAFYLEIMDHGLDKQRQVLKALLEIHEKTKIPLVATNDCHYAKKNDFEAHDARVCISTGRQIAETNRLRFETHEFYFKTPDEMAKVFHFSPESIKNTLQIAESCHVELDMKSMHLPRYDVPPGHDQDSFLEHLCKEGLKRIGKTDDPRYKERLAFELSVIKKMGFSGYFLIVWDFIKYAKTNGIPVGPGRGSGAGSLVSYSLDITMLDPIHYNLLFERFLNPDRRSMPDLDIDFSDEGRERVIEYVRKRYGETNVARIITFSSMLAKAAIKDVGRVMGIAIAETDKLTKLIPMGKTIHEALEGSPDLQEMARDPQIKKLLDLAQKLEGLKRNTSVHAAGIVITKDAVVNYTPLAQAGKSDVVTTQYDGEVLPKLGLLKMDFLGLRTLSIIQHAVENIHASGHKGFDVQTLPLDDVKAFDLLKSGKCLGVFQLDSEGMRDLVRKLKPSEFRDVVALVALYRPGPMQSGMVDDFVANKHGKKVTYEHALLKPILEDTYGCMVYQEQVMEISKSLAGFSPGQADGLRKAMGKKDPMAAEALREDFLSGCKKNKLTDKLANKIYDQMVKFGGYGFNKSHSAAYGLVAYQTAFLKANFPIEYMTALITSEIGHNALVEGKENKLVTYLNEAKAMGIEVLPPNVQKSEVKFSIEDGKIRFGLVAIKNVGEGAAESIVAARVKDGPFASADDFCRRIDLHAANKKVLESLVHAGAMDTLVPGHGIRHGRAELLATLEQTMERQARLKEDIGRGQGLLFGTESEPAAASNGKSSVEPLSEHDMLKSEKEVLGFYFSGHPLLRYRERLRCISTHPIEAITEDISSTVRVAGMVTQVKRMTTKKSGEPWARATLEDLTGEIALLVFPRAYASGLGKQLSANAIVTVSGRLSTRGEDSKPELIVEEILPIDLALQRWARRLTVSFSTTALEDSTLEALRDVLARHPGNCPVMLRVETPAHGMALVETETRVSLAGNLLEELETTLGERTWQIESAS
ncbi:MAG: DNA polymerase III subunit alpha [Elusimicrobia bacterium]|nr:DNA polymerase III subunit alpha [Elusimicrobiota bacterium]